MRTSLSRVGIVVVFALVLLTGGVGSTHEHGAPPAAHHAIEIDARLLGPGTFDVPSAGAFERTEVQTVWLPAGLHELSALVAGSVTSMPFTVSDGGIVGFPASVDGCVTGRGTSRVVIACDPQRLPVRAVLPLRGDRAIAVINDATGAVIGRIPVDGEPFGVAFHPGRRRVYVTVSRGPAADGFVAAIDTATNAVTGTITVGTEPSGVAVDPAGARVYVANFRSGTVSVIDTATDAVVATVPVDAFPLGIAVAPDGARVLVTHPGNDFTVGNTVTVIDAASGAVERTLVVPGAPTAIAVSPSEPTAFVTHSGVPGALSAIDLSLLAVSTTAFGNRPYGLTIDDAGTSVLVASIDDGTVTAIALPTIGMPDGAPVSAAFTVSTEFIGRGPETLSVAPSGRLYVTLTGEDEVAVVTDTGASSLSIGRRPFAFGRFVDAIAASIAGRVIEPDGTPIPGAIVTARSSASGAVEGTAVSAVDGSYVIASPAAGRYVVDATDNGRSSAPSPTLIVAPGRTAVDVALVMASGVKPPSSDRAVGDVTADGGGVRAPPLAAGAPSATRSPTVAAEATHPLTKSAVGETTALATDRVSALQQALAPLSVTDDFEAPVIDRTKWLDLEFVRRIGGGALELRLDRIASQGQLGFNEVRFADGTVDPAVSHSTQTDVRLTDVALSGSGNQVRARLIVGLLNDGIDEVIGDIAVAHNGGGSMEVRARIFRCASADCLTTTALFFDNTTFTPGPLGTTHTMAIAWNAGTNQVTFSFDGASLTAPTTFAAVLPSTVPRRSVGLLTVLNTEGASASVTAFFDNVVTEAGPYDDFSSSRIDPARWQGLEAASEISGSALRLSLRQRGVNGSFTIRTANPGAVSALQADVTVTELVNDPLAPTLPAARVIGSFYNNGDPGAGRVGDVLAGIGIGHDGEGWRAHFFISRCVAPNCNLANEIVLLMFDTTTFGTVDAGTPHRLSVAWDGTRFTFGFDGRTETFAPLGLPGWANAGPPKASFKGLQTRIARADTPTKDGFITATFDNFVAGHFISGRVTDGDGFTPVPGATVTVYDAGAPLATATTAADGTYTIIDIPAGTYRLGATAPGFGPGFFSGKPDLASGDAVDLPGGGAALGINVALCSGGTVNRASDAPVVTAGISNQVLGDVEIHERCAGALASGGQVRLTLPPGMTLASTPTVSPLTGNELQVGPVVTVDAGTAFAFGVTAASSTSAAKLLISGIRVDVASDAIAGPGLTSVGGTADATPGSVENATVVTASSEPTIDQRSTVSAGQGSTSQTIEIVGGNFADGATVCIGTFSAGTCTPPDGIVIELVTVVSPSRIRVNLDVEVGVQPGAYDLHVVNPGGETSTRDDGFIVSAAPRVTGTDRQEALPLFQNVPHQYVKIAGSGFQSPTGAGEIQVRFPLESGISLEPGTVVEHLSDELIALYVNVSDDAPLDVNLPVTVVNPDGGVSGASASGYVRISIAPPDAAQGAGAPKTTSSPPPPPPPSISSLSPVRAALGSSIAVNGSGFSGTPSSNAVTFAGINGTRVPSTVTAATTGQLTVTVPGQAVDGNVTVAVNGALSNAVPFTLTNPRVASVSPGTVTQGKGTTLLIAGSKFAAGATVTLDPATGIVTGTAVIGADGTSIQLPITAAATAPLGLRAVTVTNPSAGGSSTLANAVDVKAPVAGAFVLSLVGAGLTGIADGGYLPRVGAVSVTLDATGKCVSKTVTPDPITLQVQFVSDVVPAPVPPTSVAISLVSSALPGTATNEDCEPALPPAKDWSIGTANPTAQTVTVSEMSPGSGLYRVTLYSHDMGGTVKITATATSSAGITGSLKVPRDVDNDELADVYEGQYPTTLSAQNGDQNGNLVSDGQDRFARDGLSNFQKYRGVYLVGPANGQGGVMSGHQRLDPGRRHLFARGRGWGNDPLLPAGRCGIDPATGTGVVDETITLLNPCPPFSVGEAFQNRGVRVVDVTQSYTTTTQFPAKSLASPTVAILDVGTVVLDGKNCSGAEACGQLSKIGTRQATPATLGFSTFGSSTSYGSARVFWRAVKSYFEYRAYQHRTNDPNAVILGTDGRPMLAPITLVADVNDNGARDTRERVDTEGLLLGDTYIPGSGSQTLSVLDVNNDRCVELPAVPDPRTIATKCDPVAASGTSSHPSQATRRQVTQAVATHELGHAAGVNIHTADPTDLMYQYTVNWIRANHFSDTAASLIQVHNGGKQ